VRKQPFWVVWTSSSDMGMELIPTSSSRCLDLQTGGRKYGFFLRNDANALLPVFMGSCPIPQPTWGYGWSGRTFVGCNPYVGSFNGYCVEG
jgi:hypothetical protein